MSRTMRAMAVSVAIIASVGATEAATTAEWRRDVKAIVDEIIVTHPDPFTKTGRLTFTRAAQALDAALPSLSEDQRLVEAMRLVALIGDGHTQLEPNGPQFDSWYPVRLYEFTDGIFITGAESESNDLAGAQVLEIADKPAAAVLNKVRELVGADNEFDRKERAYLASSAPILKGLGYARADGSLSVKLKLRNGRVEQRILKPRASDQAVPIGGGNFEWRFFPEMMGPGIAPYEKWFGVFGEPYSAYRTADMKRPPHLTYRRAYVTRPMPEADAYYIQVNIVTNAQAEPIAAMFKRAFAEMRTKPVKRLIVDWRYNFGGDGSTLPAVVHEFIKQEDSPPWKELYLLTGRRTFSAAIMAMSALTKETTATVVGEPSGASVNHYGDASSKAFKDTGLQLNVSTLWHQLNEYDDRAWVYVDVPAPFSFADYAAGRDPAVDAILAGAEMRSIPIIAVAESGVAARAALADRRKKFARYEWWTPPGFQEIKRVGYDLLEDYKRPADAVEMLTLLVELYPDRWNSWESLGRAQIAAGMEVEGLESFQCALAIDPDTFEDGDLRAAIEKYGKPVPVAAGCPAGESA